MYEVEIKLELPEGHDAVREQLRDRGAEAGGTVIQRDTYYDAPHRSFADTDEALRVRYEERDGKSVTRLTYKGPLVESGSKTRRELETSIEDAHTVASILEALGFDLAAEVEKHREHYRLDGYVLTLDTVTDLGTYLEIEHDTPVSEDRIESVREGAETVLRDLGLDPTEQIQTSYLELLLHGE